MRKFYFLLKIAIGIFIGIGLIISINTWFLHRKEKQQEAQTEGSVQDAIPVFNKPFLEKYTDPGTGLICEPELFHFRKISVRCNQNPAFGTTIHYRHENGSFADVYLYHLDTGAKPVSPEQMKEHFQDTEKRILTASQITGLDNSNNLFNVVKLDHSTVIRKLEDVFPQSHLASYRFQIQDELTESHLVMFLKRNTLVKVRVTTTLPGQPEVADEIAGFIREFLQQAKAD